MGAQDSIDSQKEIFGKVQGLMAFLDTTEQKQSRENLEAWREVIQALREMANNPLPFLLELLKGLKAYKAVAGKDGVLAKTMRSAKQKVRKGKDKVDNAFKNSSKGIKEKFNLDVSSSAWLGTLNGIIRQSIITVLPRVDDILYEEIIKAFGCDLNMRVPVFGDGLSAPIEINISEIDLLKQLFNDPTDKVGRYMYEAADLQPGAYPPGQTKYPINRFLRDLIYNNGAGISMTVGNKQTIYGVSGRALFDIQAVNGIFKIWPYYKKQTNPGVNQNYRTAPNPSPGPGSGEKFTFIEFLKDYFGNMQIIEMQQLLAAVMEILTGFMSVRNKNFGIEELLHLEKFMASINKMLESCDGMDMETSTDSLNKLSELYDDDSFYDFTVEETRNIKLDVTKKSKNVISLKSCGNVEIPIDNDVIDKGLDNILATQNINEKIKAFDLVIQEAASSAAQKYGFEIGLGQISLPVEIDFKENLIKKLPQILVYCILSPKAILPVVLTSKLLNQTSVSSSNIEIWGKIFKRVIIRVVKEILAEVMKHLMRLVKEFLLRLIREAIKRKLSEKNKKLIRMIRKLLDILLPLIIALQEAKSCKEIYNILLAVLLANMPDIPFKVPPFLVSAACFRQGTSTLGAFEKFLGKMQDQGIPIGDMPDGSPNIFLMSQFSLMQAMDEETADNAKVSSVIMMGQVITPNGPGLIKPLTETCGLLA